jgi:pyrroline-5-carboxylate reductase
MVDTTGSTYVAGTSDATGEAAAFTDARPPVRQLAVIGGGKMGGAIARRAIETGLLPADRLTVCEPIEALRQRLQEQIGIRALADCGAAVAGASSILLAVRPQEIDTVLAALHGRLTSDQLVLSIAAGVELKTLSHGLGHGAVIRVMPNTPAQVGESISAWIAADEVTEAQKAEARAILGCFGRELEVDRERTLDMVTALSGSGPAWVMLMLEAMTDAGVQIGLKREWAYDLALQTINGSAALARQTGLHPAELRNMVTTPGGTTAAGLFAMEQGGLRTAIMSGIVAAYKRSVEMGEEARRRPR